MNMNVQIITQRQKEKRQRLFQWAKNQKTHIL
jgi:hypothetical protein